MSVGNHLKTWLPAGIVIVTMAVTWGVYSARLSASESNTDKVEKRVAEVEKNITEIKQSAVRVETNQSAQQRQLDRIERLMERLAEIRP